MKNRGLILEILRIVNDIIVDERATIFLRKFRLHVDSGKGGSPMNS